MCPLALAVALAGAMGAVTRLDLEDIDLPTETQISSPAPLGWAAVAATYQAAAALAHFDPKSAAESHFFKTGAER